jgi:hypothetical protein
MSFESWMGAVDPKVKGSWNLHSQLPQQSLDFFVLLSSIAGVFGSAGQANYAAGNTYLDALAHYRVSHGQPGVAIDLGAMKGEGFLAENDEFVHRWAGPGYFIQVSPEELYALLDHYCAQKNDKSPMVPAHDATQSIIGFEIPSNLLSRGIEDPRWMRQPLFSHLYQISGTADANSVDAEALLTPVSPSAQLGSAESMAAAGMIVATMLLRKVSRAFSILEDQMDVSESLRLYGVDSLVALELRNWFAKELSVDIAIFDLLSGTTFVDIGLIAANRTPFCQKLRNKKTETEVAGI